jgi:hypothetical protein
MKSLAFLVTVFCSFAAVAEPSMCAYGKWQDLTLADRAKVQEVDRSLTEAAAKSAQTELEKRLSAKLTDPARRNPGTSKLMATIEGWLLKKELLAAQARHEHDADEVNDYCWFLRKQAGVQ